MEITFNGTQTVPVNGRLAFDNTIIPGCCSIIHTNGSGNIKLRGLTNTQNRARFHAFFGANIAVPAEQTEQEISLALTIDGEPIGPTRMSATPTATDAYFNVGADIYLDVPCGCCSSLSVSNVSGIPVNVRNANLIVERVA